MKLTRCEQGHFYDGDKYNDCPNCSGLREKDKADPKKITEDDPWGIHEDPAFLYCENGHYYDIRKCTRCPVCGTTKLKITENQETEKEKPPMKLVCCENGHFYNGAILDDCPFCGSHGVSPVTDPKFLRSCAEFYSDEITLEPVFARCENGHTYNRELYARCPVCEKDAQEKKENQEAEKEKPPMKLRRCENGHFYNGAKYDSCPYCSELPEFGGSGVEDVVMCENGHTYSTGQGLYTRCPECGVEREKRKKQPRMDIMRCEKGHFYNREVYDSCPYCSEEALKENRPPDEKQQNGQEENLSDKSEPSVKKAKLIVNITYCEKGHYYDGELYDTCPYCRDAAQDDDDEKTII